MTELAVSTPPAVAPRQATRLGGARAPGRAALDQRGTPYLEELCRYAAQPRRGAFHVPGHVQGAGAHPKLVAAVGQATLSLDLCSGLGDLDGGVDSALGRAEALAAQAYGADRSWFLVNGSTSGNHIMISSVCGPGEVILTSRNTHKSIISSFMVSGARPAYLPVEFDPELRIAQGVRPEEVRAGLARHPEARAVLIVSPTYYGACSDIEAIARVCHDAGVPLLVDQAWGPHFPFHGSLPPHALSVGADMVVTGCHKLLGAFTQASMLHVRGRLVDPGHVDVVRRLLETTSPSCLLYASLDVARMQMVTEGELALQEAIELAEEARFRLGSHPLLRCLDKTLVGSYGVAALDPTRLCVDVSRTGHTGYQVERMLRAEGVVVEMSDFTNVLANITIAHRWDQVDALVEGLVAIADAATGPPPGRGGAGAVLPAQPEAAMSPAEAFHAPQQPIPLGDAAGRVAAELAASYPPGIPVVCPGERLTRPLVDYLAAQVRAGCRMVGPEDPTLGTINVVR